MIPTPNNTMYAIFQYVEYEGAHILGIFDDIRDAYEAVDKAKVLYQKNHHLRHEANRFAFKVEAVVTNRLEEKEIRFQ